MTIFSSVQDYAATVVAPALGAEAEGYDVDAIAAEMLVWKDAHDARGRIYINESGYVVREDKDFWQVVATHETN